MIKLYEFMSNSRLLGLPIVAEPIIGYAVGKTGHGLVEVLVDCPGSEALYTYNIPPQFDVRVGDILSIPFRDRIVGGIAIRFIDSAALDFPVERIKDIEDVVASGLFRSEIGRASCRERVLMPV